MRLVIQRVSEAEVRVDNQSIGKIKHGLLILVGIETEDSVEDAEWLAKKVVNMRLFNDEEGHINLSVKEVDGQILSISQFTLHANTRKGNRPSFMRAAKPEFANELYQQFNRQVSFLLNKQIETGEFGADMKVQLVNDGPVTIFIDSKNKE